MFILLYANCVVMYCVSFDVVVGNKLYLISYLIVAKNTTFFYSITTVLLHQNSSDYTCVFDVWEHFLECDSLRQSVAILDFKKVAVCFALLHTSLAESLM